jgi:hypothetical protein
VGGNNPEVVNPEVLSKQEVENDLEFLKKNVKNYMVF